MKTRKQVIRKKNEKKIGGQAKREKEERRTLEIGGNINKPELTPS